jgi:hypothetical protein
MTPREVDAMTRDEYLAFWRYAERQAKEAARQARKSGRR